MSIRRSPSPRRTWWLAAAILAAGAVAAWIVPQPAGPPPTVWLGILDGRASAVVAAGGQSFRITSHEAIRARPELDDGRWVVSGGDWRHRARWIQRCGGDVWTPLRRLLGREESRAPSGTSYRIVPLVASGSGVPAEWRPHATEQERIPPRARPAAERVGRWQGVFLSTLRFDLELFEDGTAAWAGRPQGVRRWGELDGVVYVEQGEGGPPGCAPVTIGVVRPEGTLDFPDGVCGWRITR